MGVWVCVQSTHLEIRTRSPRGFIQDLIARVKSVARVSSDQNTKRNPVLLVMLRKRGTVSVTFDIRHLHQVRTSHYRRGSSSIEGFRRHF